MKNISFALLLASLLFSIKLNGQCLCYELSLVKNINDSCQLDVTVRRTATCPVGGIVNEITFSITDMVSIISAASADTMVVVGLNADQTEAVFTTDFDLATLPLSQKRKIGSIRLASSQFFSNFDGKIGGAAPVGTVCNFPGFAFDVACSLLPVTTFDKLYGNAEDNYPQKVKGFNNYTYVLASRIENMTEYATFSKFKNDGTLVWDYQMTIPSRLLDFEQADKLENSFLLVGRTEPFQNANGPQDNKSLLVKIKDLGTSATLEFSQQFAHTGREHFTRIINHPNAKTLPGGSKFPFYVVGSKNIDSALPMPPNSIDQMMVYCFNKDGMVGWKKQYPRQIELESHRGLFPTADGNIVVLGNDIPNNGILIQIDGATGAVIRGKKYNTPLPTGGPIQYDFNDGLEETANGDVIIAGTDFTNAKGILLRLSGTNTGNPFAPINGKRYEELSEFLELGKDNVGRFHLLSPENVTGKKYPVSMQVTPAFMPNYSTHIDDGEELFKNPRFSVTPNASRIFYADSRSISNTLVNYDMLVGAFDLNIFNPQSILFCLHPIIIHVTNISPTMDTISVFAQNIADIETPNGALIPLPYNCYTFCAPIICNTDFTWTTGPCYNIKFLGTSTGTGPFSFNWNFNDGSTNSTLQNPLHSFPSPGTYNVCLTIIDAVGCVNMICHDVIVLPDNLPPTCTPPSNITVNTDPGLCSALRNPVVSATDNCGSVTFSAVLSGATTGTVLNTNYNKGVTFVAVTVTDMSGLQTPCQIFTITVVDNERPKISCPPNIISNTPFCDGDPFITLPPPLTLTDNCPMVTYTSSHQSGKNFPCGTTTTVYYTATDMAPASNTQTCSFTVKVNCDCAAIGTTSIECDPMVDDKYLFTIPVNSLNNATSCTATVSGTNQAGVVLMANSINFTQTGTLTGMITVTNPIPMTLDLVVDVLCVCANGQINHCVLPVSLTPVCCKRISVGNKVICSKDNQVLVPLVGCGQFSQIQLVNWYVASGPTCPPWPGLPLPQGSPWHLQQSSIDCSDLLLSPHLYSHSIWVQAVMYVGDFPCTVVPTNIACITLCEPLKCSISPPIQEFCFVGSPITAQPLQLPNLATLPADCTVSIDDWTANGVSTGQSGSTYTPTNLTLPGNFSDCYLDFNYGVTIRNLCGSETCLATVRLYNDAASIGTLEMDPIETPDPVFCPGYEFTLVYTPECSQLKPSDPPMWTWWVSTTSATAGFSPIQGPGDMNPQWNTNELYQDHWYQVKSHNGVCAEKSVTYYIDIFDPFAIDTFSVHPIMTPPDCVVTGLDMSISISGIDADCPAIVKWIKNGQVIFSHSYSSSPATWSYEDPSLEGDYSGNYWVVVERECCHEVLKSNLITIDPPCYLELTGPCYLMEGGEAELSGELINPKPGVICKGQWFKWINGVLTPIAGLNVNPVTVTEDGVYVYKVTCGDGCVKSGTFPLDLCYHDCTDVATDFSAKPFSADIIPNPNAGSFTVELSEGASEGMAFRILGPTTQVLMEQLAQVGSKSQMVKADELPAGMYFLQVVLDGKILAVRKFVKQ